jgi:hypothetical protein
MVTDQKDGVYAGQGNSLIFTNIFTQDMDDLCLKEIYEFDFEVQER